MIASLVVACGSSGTSEPPASHPPAKLAWIERDEAAAFTRARAERKGVLIDVTVQWSVPSQELSRMLDEPSIREVIAPAFVPLRIDVSAATEDDQAIQERYAATTLPALVLVDHDGNVLARLARLVELPELRATIEGAARRRSR